MSGGLATTVLGFDESQLGDATEGPSNIVANNAARVDRTVPCPRLGSDWPHALERRLLARAPLAVVGIVAIKLLGREESRKRT